MPFYRFCEYLKRRKRSLNPYRRKHLVFFPVTFLFDFKPLIRQGKGIIVLKHK